VSVKEMKTTSKPREIKAMIMEPNKLTEHDLGTTDNVKLEIKHDGKTLKFKKGEVLQKIFAEKTWLGDTKRYYVFCKLANSGSPELIGLEEFDPYTAISAEEADIMVHEALTIRGIKNLVAKVKGAGGAKKIYVFVIILVTVITLAFMKSQGMI